MSLSLSSLLQYTVLIIFAYVLAGAPLLSILSPSSSASEPQISFNQAESLVYPESNLTCPEHKYAVHILSREPLVVYIEGFLSDEESKHVVQMSEPSFTPSTVWTSGQERLDPTVRLSSKAKLDRDQTVKCIEERARTFQGWRSNLFIERLWSQKYGIGGHYTYHYDWSASKSRSGRVSSFMVYLEAECEGGETHFPRLKRPEGKEWCRFIECGEGEEQRSGEGSNGSGNGRGRKEEGERALEGVTFKPIKGNAVFWENMRSDGSGYKESWHAGLPVKRGTKIGLNIWSWYQHGYVPEV